MSKTLINKLLDYTRYYVSTKKGGILIWPKTKESAHGADSKIRISFLKAFSYSMKPYLL